MEKFEYKVITKTSKVAGSMKIIEEFSQEVESLLNDMGQEGWEFCSWNTSMIILKRKIR